QARTVDNGNRRRHSYLRIVTCFDSMKKGAILSRLYFALTKIILKLVGMRLGALLQRLAVPDQSLAAVLRHLVILREFQGVGRTRIFTESTKHAPAQIVGKLRQFLA